MVVGEQKMCNVHYTSNDTLILHSSVVIVSGKCDNCMIVARFQRNLIRIANVKYGRIKNALFLMICA